MYTFCNSQAASEALVVGAPSTACRRPMRVYALLSRLMRSEMALQRTATASGAPWASFGLQRSAAAFSSQSQRRHACRRALQRRQGGPGSAAAVPPRAAAAAPCLPPSAALRLHSNSWRCQATASNSSNGSSAALSEELSVNALKRRQDELQQRISDAVKVWLVLPLLLLPPLPLLQPRCLLGART